MTRRRRLYYNPQPPVVPPRRDWDLLAFLIRPLRLLFRHGFCTAPSYQIGMPFSPPKAWKCGVHQGLSRDIKTVAIGSKRIEKSTKRNGYHCGTKAMALSQLCPAVWQQGSAQCTPAKGASTAICQLLWRHQGGACY